MSAANRKFSGASRAQPTGTSGSVTDHSSGGAEAVPKGAGARGLFIDGTTRFTVRVTNDWRQLELLKSDWEELAANALEPSPTAEAWMLIPALRYKLPGKAVRVAMIFAVDASSSSPNEVLCGVFPIEERARFGSLPTRVVRLWNHIYSLGSAPLVRRSCAASCVRAFINWTRAEHPVQTIIHFPDLRVESKFFSTLIQAFKDDVVTYWIADTWTRAIFRPKADAESYVQSISTAHHRHEWRRQERRLSEKGGLTYDLLTTAQQLPAWLDEFVRLEMSGWKGRAGTAFGCSDHHRLWLSEVATEASGRGRLMMLALRLDGKAIAMRVSILAPPGSYAFKIAYDESLLKYSPGVLLELENIRRLHTTPGIEWMDSMAAPFHPLMNRVWDDRVAIVSLLAAPGPLLGRMLLSSIPLLQMLKQLFTRRRRGVGVTSPDRSF